MEQTQTRLQFTLEHSITVPKQELVSVLASKLEESDREEFLRLRKRLELWIRCCYKQEFRDLQDLYAYFNPRTGSTLIRNERLDSIAIRTKELAFLDKIFKLLESSKFKRVTAHEWRLATASGHYLLDLPIRIDTSKLDTKLLSNSHTTERNSHTVERGPDSSGNQYVIFRRGFSKDKRRGIWLLARISAFWWSFCQLLFQFLWSGFEQNKEQGRHAINDMEAGEATRRYQTIERVHVGDTRIRECFSKVEIQEPVLNRVIVLYRHAGEYGIRIKQYRDVPLADLEIVLPMKKPPRPSTGTFIQLVLAITLGVLAFVYISKRLLWVATLVLVAALIYCGMLMIRFAFQALRQRKLLQRCYVRDKRLREDYEPLYNLLQDVVEQQVKRAVLSYFVLLHERVASQEELNLKCETLLSESFGEKCCLSMEDALERLIQLKIASEDFKHLLRPKEANEALEGLRQILEILQ